MKQLEHFMQPLPHQPFINLKFKLVWGFQTQDMFGKKPVGAHPKVVI